MKKSFVLFNLTAALAATSVALLATPQPKEVVALDAGVDGVIEINQSFFTNWTTDAGDFGDKNSTFWDAYHFFNSLGSFYRGEAKEGWTGTLESNSWTQTTQYVYFTWSAANNTPDAKLIFHCGDEDDGVFEYSGEMQNDTFVGNPMMLRYFKIPDEEFAKLTTAHPSGFDMRVYLYDNRTSDYGFHNFGYLHVNQTEEQVSDAMRFYLNSLDHDGGSDQIAYRKSIYNHYTDGNAGLKEVFYRTVSNIDEDFEDNDVFLNHWYFDYNYFNGGNWDLRFDKAIGHDSFRPDDNTKMPFNIEDNGFFRGWFEDEELGGFVSGDGSKYRFISRPFVLGGTGLVSIKIAGTASLHVVDPATRQELAFADCQTFNTEGNQADLMDGSFNTVTMVRHVVNLEAYVGKKIQLAIADFGDGGWSALYADELISNYPSYPGFKVDAFNQTNNGGSHDIYKADKYINSTNKSGDNGNGLIYVDSADINKANDNEILNHVDNSPANDAFEFLDDYYSVLRGNEFSYANADADARNNVINAYIALSANAQGIVGSSKDILSATNTSQDISVAFGPYLDSFSKFNVSFNANGGTGTAASQTLVNGTTFTLPESDTFDAPEGKKFAEWNTANDGTGESKQPGETYTISEDVTFYAIWEDTAKTKIEALDTRALLSYSYTGNATDGFSYSDVKIRFGGFVSKALWDELNEESAILSYGVMISLATTETEGFIGSDTFKDRYASALTEADSVDAAISAVCDGSKIKNFEFEVSDMPFLYEAAEYDIDEDTYAWNLVQKVNAPTSLQRTYVAIAYIKTNDGVVFLNESRESPKSIAQRMIAGPDYDDDSLGGSLKNLAQLA